MDLYGPKMASSLSLFVFKPGSFATVPEAHSKSLPSLPLGDLCLSHQNPPSSVSQSLATCPECTKWHYSQGTKPRAQPHPAGVSQDHNRVDSFIFSALTCPGTKHILSQRSPQAEQRYHTKPSGSETGIFLLSAQPPVGGKNREYFTKLFQKMLC